jgi:hypothetical protein
MGRRASPFRGPYGAPDPPTVRTHRQCATLQQRRQLSQGGTSGGVQGRTVDPFSDGSSQGAFFGSARQQDLRAVNLGQVLRDRNPCCRGPVLDGGPGARMDGDQRRACRDLVALKPIVGPSSIGIRDGETRLAQLPRQARVHQGPEQSVVLRHLVALRQVWERLG